MVPLATVKCGDGRVKRLAQLRVQRAKTQRSPFSDDFAHGLDVVRIDRSVIHQGGGTDAH